MCRQCRLLAVVLLVPLVGGCELFPAGLDPACTRRISDLCCAEPEAGGRSCECAVGDYRCSMCAHATFPPPFCASEDPAAFCQAHPNDAHCRTFAQCNQQPDYLICNPGGREEICRIERNSELLFGLGSPMRLLFCAESPSRIEVQLVLDGASVQLDLDSVIASWLTTGGPRALHLRSLAGGGDGRPPGVVLELDPAGEDLVGHRDARPAPSRRVADLEVVAVVEVPSNWRLIGTVALSASRAGARPTMELVTDAPWSTAVAPVRRWLAAGGSLRLGVDLTTRRLFELSAEEIAQARTAPADGPGRAVWWGSLEVTAETLAALAEQWPPRAAAGLAGGPEGAPR